MAEMEAFARANVPSGEVSENDIWAELHAGTNDLDAAEAHYRDAHDLWSAIGASGANVSTINLGLTLLQRHDWDGAASILIPLAEQLENENAGLQLTFALAATLPVFAARGDTTAYHQALQRFDACRASYQIHDPDLDLIFEMCISLWEHSGGEQQIRDTRRAFGFPGSE